MARARTKKAKTGSTATGAPKEAKKKGKKKSAGSEVLEQSTREARAKYTNAQRTTAAYAGYLARGSDFLAEVVAERRKKELEDPKWVCPQNIDTDILAEAFSKPPNEHSAAALEMFITQKCIVEMLGKSTAEGIHGAYAKFWDTMDGDKYAGEYHYDEENEKVKGCPARAGIVASLVKIIKIRDNAKGAAATRNHAEAISAEDMKIMMNWSESVCPSFRLTSAVTAALPQADSIFGRGTSSCVDYSGET
ncbi:hypothetical protein DFH06DRAFT_1390895 [Mycena polygramma]|nr:hypothetical protein DFH06DRAFT_1390895 [Mycena polygramma]